MLLDLVLYLICFSRLYVLYLQDDAALEKRQEAIDLVKKGLMMDMRLVLYSLDLQYISTSLGLLNRFFSSTSLNK